MTDVEIVVGLLITWATSPERLQPEHPDGTSGGALRVVHELVVTKLGGDPALQRLELEALESGQARPRTRARLEMALEDAAEDDLSFARELEKAVNDVRKTDDIDDHSRGSVINQITGNVSGRVVQARDITGGVTFHERKKEN